MVKRAIATLLWFLAGWTAAAWFAYAVGAQGAPTLLGGVVGAAVFWFALAGVVWSSSPAVETVRRVGGFARLGR